MDRDTEAEEGDEEQERKGRGLVTGARNKSSVETILAFPRGLC